MIDTGYERALKINPNLRNAKFNYANCLYLQDEHLKAVEQYRIILKNDPVELKTGQS